MTLGQKIAIGYLRANVNMLAVISKKKAAAKALRLFCTPFRGSRKRMPPVFAQAETLQFTLDNKTITGYRWNHPRPKKFLILHGFHSYSGNFDRFVSPMIKKDYEVMAFDAPAHGKSEGKQVNVLQYKSMIEAVFNRFGPIDAYLAHSFGGLALSLALEAIPHTKDTRVVLIAPATETSTAVNALFRFLQLGKEVRREFDKLIVQVSIRPVQWFSVARAIHNISARILWVHDENDDITPLEDVKPVIQADHKNIEFLITQGYGHRRIYRENKVVKAVLAFF